LTTSVKGGGGSSSSSSTPPAALIDCRTTGARCEFVHASPPAVYGMPRSYGVDCGRRWLDRGDPLPLQQCQRRRRRWRSLPQV